MKLQLFEDTDESPVSTIDAIESDSEAELYVRETSGDFQTVTRWLLTDNVGPRCEWHREIVDLCLPHVTRRSFRYCGEWEQSPEERQFELLS